MGLVGKAKARPQLGSPGLRLLWQWHKFSWKSHRVLLEHQRGGRRRRKRGRRGKKRGERWGGKKEEKQGVFIPVQRKTPSY